MQLAPWRAASQLEKLEKLGTQSPPKKKGRGSAADEAEEEGTDEDMGGDSAAKPKGGRGSKGAGKAQKLTGSGTKDGSSGQAQTSKGGISANGGKPLSNKELTSAVALLAKASLSSHDNIRELQANLHYTYMFAPEDNAIMETNLSEGKSYFSLKTQTLKAAEGDTPEARTEKVKALGPAAASQLAAVIEKLVETEVKQADPAHFHWAKVKELSVGIQGMALDDMVKMTGTWLTRKAHGSNKKIVARPGPGMKPDIWDSICFLCARAGMKVHRHQKPPRDGVHRAVQGLID